MNVTRKNIEQYTLSGKTKDGYDTWGKIALDCTESAVFVQISSDFGSWSCWWNATGGDPKKFLMKISKQYTLQSFSSDKAYILDEKETLNPQMVAFWDNIWLPFIEELKREIKEEKLGGI